MPLVPYLPNLLFGYRCGMGVVWFLILAIYAKMGGVVLAQEPYENANTPEGWAWAQIKEGKKANFNEGCGTPELKSRAEDEAGWTDSCRRISGTFLIDILTRAPWHNQVPFVGVNIIGARIEGDIDLRNAKLDRSFLIEQSRIEGNVDLDAARTDSVIGFIASRVAGDFSANQFRAVLSLRLSNSLFRQDASLSDAKTQVRARRGSEIEIMVQRIVTN
jgi:hypothetical protein